MGNPFSKTRKQETGGETGFVEIDKVPTPAPKRARLDGNGNKNGRDTSSAQEQLADAAARSLPEEILERIFSYLDSAKDLHAVSNASDQFNRILAPTKTVWAFESVFPKLFSKLSTSDILNCRLVCKKWCQAVDQDLQSRPISQIYCMHSTGYSQTPENLNRPSYAPRFRTSLFSKGFADLLLVSPNYIRSFLDDMGNNWRNPFIERAVTLHNSGGFEDYWEAALSFLERFGSDIWHVCIVSYDYDDLPVNRPFVSCRYELLAKILGHLPNLKTLRLCGTVEGYINCPLPVLPHLQTLEILVYDDNNNRILVLDEVLSAYASQLEFLGWCNLIRWQRHGAHLANMSQLKEITVGIIDMLPVWQDLCHRLIAPHLVKMNLIMWDTWPVSELLEPLSRSLPTLRYLSLLFHRAPNNFKMLTPPRFVLENVKTLEIVDSCMVEYNQLFQHLPAVEYLLVCHQQCRGNNVSFNEPQHWNLFHWMQGTTIENSDIWTRLACLKELTLARLGDNGNNVNIENEIRARKTFTREMYARV